MWKSADQMRFTHTLPRGDRESRTRVCCSRTRVGAADGDQSTRDSAAPRVVVQSYPERLASPLEVRAAMIAPEDLDPVAGGEVVDDDRSADDDDDEIGHLKEPP